MANGGCTYERISHENRVQMSMSIYLIYQNETVVRLAAEHTFDEQTLFARCVSSSSLSWAWLSWHISLLLKPCVSLSGSTNPSMANQSHIFRPPHFSFERVHIVSTIHTLPDLHLFEYPSIHSCLCVCTVSNVYLVFVFFFYTHNSVRFAFNGIADFSHCVRWCTLKHTHTRNETKRTTKNRSTSRKCHRMAFGIAYSGLYTLWS